MQKQILCVLFIGLLIHGCNKQEASVNNRLLDQLNNKLTEAIVHDGFSPPVASRIYAYCNVAAYQSVYYKDGSLKSLSNQLNALCLAEPNGGFLSSLNEEVVLLRAFEAVAVELLYRDYIIQEFCDSSLAIYKSKLSLHSYKSSSDYGDTLASKIIDWSRKDNYQQTRNMPRFVAGEQSWNWLPTSPTYGEAAEPHFGKIRAMAMDSYSHFKVQEYVFSTDTTSVFFVQQVKPVFDACAIADSNSVAISKFWDCNPQRTIATGHVMYNARQMTPGGHWVAIATNACSVKNLSLAKSAESVSLTSIALFDAFLNCWSEKYRSNFIRPETYIRRYYKADWVSVLETPLFPEHPSGHSTVSAAAAAVLTNLIGDNFAYIDSSEILYGQPPRSYGSFNEAANEAGGSRVMAGIHFPLSCTEGVLLGEKIGNHVLERVKTR